MKPRVEIDEYMLRGRRLYGQLRLRRLAVAALIAGALFAAVGAFIIGRDPNQGWNQVPQRWPALVVAFALGAAFEVLGSLFLEWRALLITDEGISVIVRRRRRMWYPREAVRSLAIRCWPNRHILNDAHWSATLEVNWIAPDQRPLTIYGAARGIEGVLPALAQHYHFREYDVRPPDPGDPTETDQVRQELAGIARVRKIGRRRVCFYYGALPAAAVVFVGASLLLAFRLGWRQALALAAALALLAMLFGYFSGLVVWCLLAQRGRMLERRLLNPEEHGS